MKEPERRGNGVKRQQLERGSLNAYAALVASEHGLPGITARVRKPKDRHGARFVEVETTPQGDDWLSRLSDHPYTHALTLMFDAQRIESDLEKNGGGMTKIEAHKKRSNMTGLRENAKKILGDATLPPLGDETIRSLLGAAVTTMQLPAQPA